LPAHGASHIIKRYPDFDQLEPDFENRTTFSSILNKKQMFTYKKQTLRRIGKHDIAPLAISKGIAHCFIGEKRLWSLGLENIPQLPGNRAEVGQNHDMGKVVPATLSV